MKIGSRILFSLYAGFVVATLVHIIYGPAGLFAYGNIESEAVKLEKNLEELKGIHTALSVEFDSLRRSGEQVALKARDLGYLNEGEGIIDVPYIWHPSRSYYAVGRMVGADRTIRSRSQLGLAAGLIVMTIVFLLSGSVDTADPGRKRARLKVVSPGQAGP